MAEEKVRPVWTATHAKASTAVYREMLSRGATEGLFGLTLREVALDRMADQIVDRLVADGFIV